MKYTVFYNLKLIVYSFLESTGMNIVMINWFNVYNLYMQIKYEVYKN